MEVEDLLGDSHRALDGGAEEDTVDVDHVDHDRYHQERIKREVACLSRSRHRLSLVLPMTARKCQECGDARLHQTELLQRQLALCLP